jgi:putative acetyltransferase
MANAMRVREATVGDYDAIADVMFDAVRNGPSMYTEEQRQAWVPEPRRGVD